MKKSLLLVSLLAVALVACGKKEEAPAASTPAVEATPASTPAAAPASTPAVEAAPASATAAPASAPAMEAAPAAASAAASK